MQCPSCSANLPEGSNFCEQCGTALPRPCPACRHANSMNARFCSQCGASLAAGASAPPVPTNPRSTSSARATPTIAPAERRHLTIMFCDMVGSSSLSTRLDPEEQREVVGVLPQSVPLSLRLGRKDRPVAFQAGLEGVAAGD